jgi:cAMP phosphodiesterase
MAILEVIGADGGKRPGSNLVSMRLGSSVLVDTGSGSSLHEAELASLEMVLITHAHLDHILELGLLIDASVSSRDRPIRVASSAASLQAIRAHYMNDLIWPDFSRIHTSSGQTVIYEELRDYEWLELPGDITALPVPVNHGAGGRGFIFRSRTGSIVYTGDTGPTTSIWNEAAKLDDLRFIVAEVSFPDSRKEVAIAADHLTPELLLRELSWLEDRTIPIYAFHLKPWHRQEIDRDLSRQFSDRAVLLMKGDRLSF